MKRNYRENFTPSSSAEESKLFPCVLAVPGLALGPYSPSHEALRERERYRIINITTDVRICVGS